MAEAYFFSDEELSKEIYFDSLELDYLPMSDSKIKNSFYETTVDKGVTVMRNCYDDSECLSNPFKPSGKQEENSVFSTRKTLPQQYFLKDILEDIFVSSSKNKIKTCNGTNKTGDMFYYGLNKQSDFNKIQNKPPVKVPIFNGEKLKMVGFYIKSPYLNKPNIVEGTEYTDIETNVKTYNSLYSKSYDISTLTQKDNIDDGDIVVINNHLEFSYENYDPHKNYFIIFNNNDNQKINKEEFTQSYLNKLVPSISEILQFEKSNIQKCSSINDIEKVINRYGIYFKDLNVNSLQKIRQNITKNIISLNDKQVQTKLNYLTNKQLYSKFNHIYNQIILVNIN